MTPAPSLATPRRASLTGTQTIGYLAAVALATAALVMAFDLVRSPGFVDEVTFVNPTPFDFNIEINDARHDGWVPVSVLQPSTDTTVPEVLDQGDTWIFRISRQGVVLAQLRLHRTTLDARRWRVTIPPYLTTTLISEGQLPPPSR